MRIRKLFDYNVIKLVITYYNDVGLEMAKKNNIYNTIYFNDNVFTIADITCFRAVSQYFIFSLNIFSGNKMLSTNLTILLNLQTVSKKKTVIMKCLAENVRAKRRRLTPNC